jgi:hypothetical protein
MPSYRKRISTVISDHDARLLNTALRNLSDDLDDDGNTDTARLVNKLRQQLKDTFEVGEVVS